jgi:hypothetical protein
MPNYTIYKDETNKDKQIRAIFSDFSPNRLLVIVFVYNYSN